MYLSVTEKEYGFKHPKINKITDEDIEISDEIYKKFFREQEKGKLFRIKNKDGQTFDEIFEVINY